MILGIYGKPRSGKTTYAAKVAASNHFAKMRYLKKHGSLDGFKGYPVIYCTDPSIMYTVTIDYSDVGTFKPTWGSLFIFEEAGIGFNNRDFKKLTSDATYFFATCGHNNVDIIWSSQSVDVDKKLKERTHRIYICEKKGVFSIMHLIDYSVDVVEHMLDDYYTKPEGLVMKLGDLLFHRTKIIYRPRWYKYFNSFIDEHEYKDIAPDQKPCKFVLDAKASFVNSFPLIQF